MRWLLALLCLALTVPTAAQDEGLSRLNGAWQGTVAGMPVHVCFDWRDWRSQPDLLGIYYYDHVKRLIRLQPDGDLLRERVGHGGKGGATWSLSQVLENALAGEWSGGQGPRPIRLSRMPVEPVGQRVNPCESEAFMGPRFVGGEVLSHQAWLGGQAYTLLSYEPPAHFSAERDGDLDRLAIQSFAIAEDQPGDRAINAVLALYMPRESMADESAQCVIGNAAWNGVDGDFSQVVQLEMLGERWLGLVESNSIYCGGAHPSYWERRRVFDRRNGREIDVASWLSERGFVREAQGRGETAYLRQEMTEELRAVVLRNWPDGENDEPDCISVVESAFGWDVGLVEEGLAFIPSVPHAATVCAYTVVVPWNDIEPFLSPQGRVVMLTFAP